MNGPLLIGLLPPERLWDSDGIVSDALPLAAVFFMAGLILSFLLRRPER